VDGLQAWRPLLPQSPANTKYISEEKSISFWKVFTVQVSEQTEFENYGWSRHPPVIHRLKNP
jgi:hypothetical protein